jgi:hypothetical protein
MNRLTLYVPAQINYGPNACNALFSYARYNIHPRFVYLFLQCFAMTARGVKT